MIRIYILAIMFIITFNTISGAPYIKPNKIPNIPEYYDDSHTVNCCEEDEPYFEQITKPDLLHKIKMENLLYIPFSEMTINDFGVHKYVVNRNIKTLMEYHTDSHLINIIVNSLNQSVTEITRLVTKNRAEFDSMAKNKFISDFLDFWCAYRLIQLSEFSTNNLDVLANMIFKSSPN